MADRNYGAIRDVETLEKFVNRCIQSGKDIGFDIEAGYTGPDREKGALLQYYPTWLFAGFSFTIDTNWARYVPVAHDGGGNIDDVVQCARLLWRLLSSGRIVAHNASYELTGTSRFLRETLWNDPLVGAQIRESFGGFPIKDDTWITAWLSAEYEPLRIGKDLKSIALAAFGLEMTHYPDLFPTTDTELGPALPKAKIKYSRFNTRNSYAQKVIDYACEDAVATLMIHEKHYERLYTEDPLGTDDSPLLPMKDTLIFKAEHGLIHVLWDMERGPVDPDTGYAQGNLFLDWDIIHAKAKECDEFRIKMNEEIHQLFSERLDRPVSVNLNSIPQMRKILYDSYPEGLGLPINDKFRSEKTNEPSTSDDALRVLAKDDAIIRRILDYRQVVKLYGSYLHKFERDIDYSGTGVVFPNHNQAGALTGRMSVDHVSYQQWPKPYHYELRDGTTFDFNFRNIMIAPDDFRIVGFDFSQVELRVLAGQAQETAMLKAFADGTDIHMATASTMLRIPLSDVTKKERASGKTLNFACVPLDSEILTRDGWKRHDEVRVGDLTLGINPVTQQSEWTPIREIVHYDQAPLVKMSSGSWESVSTPNHRWVDSKRRRGSWGEVTTETISSETRLQLSAPVAAGSLLPISPEEAALIGWAATDGSVRISPLTGGSSQAGGARRAVEVKIFQSKERFVRELDNLMRNFEHTRSIRPSVNGRDPIVSWRLPSAVARDIWTRADLLGGDDALPEFVRRLGSSELLAFFDACYAAEGGHRKDGSRNGTLVQNVGPVADAIELAAFLMGTRVTKSPKSSYTGVACQQMNMNRSVVTGQRIVREEVEAAPVWCVVTDLQTWTMRQGDHIMITGNTVYGSGPANIADMLSAQGSPTTKEQAEEMLEKYYSGFSNLRAWMDRKVADGHEQGFVETPFGRKFTIWEYKDHRDWIRKKGDRMCVNAPIQGGAADYLKIGMNRVRKAIQKAGLTDKVRLVMTVHDALEFYIHKSVDTQTVIDLISPCVAFPFKGLPEIRADWHEGTRWGLVVELELDKDGKISGYGWEDPDGANHDFKTLEEAYAFQDSWVSAKAKSGIEKIEEHIASPPPEEPQESSEDDETKTAVISLQEMPESESWEQFQEFVRARPGKMSVRVETPEGAVTLDETSKLSKEDQGILSLLLGGADIHILSEATDVELEEVFPF